MASCLMGGPRYPSPSTCCTPAVTQARTDHHIASCTYSHRSVPSPFPGQSSELPVCSAGDTKIVKLLLAAKARTDLKTNVKAPGGAGRTALDLANAKQATARKEDRVRWTSLAHVLVKAAAKGRMEEL